ncbi:LOB domain-containing protein 22 [Nymphaea thermarum]|nr:LOB domain-containing protein 22 [Nymphaea thermarum]
MVPATGFLRLVELVQILANSYARKIRAPSLQARAAGPRMQPTKLPYPSVTKCGRLFGVTNILKIIRNLEPEHRDDAMRSIILEAATRAKDPVRGCLGVILDLKKQILWTTAELEVTLARLHDVKQLLDTLHGNPAATHLGLPIRSFRNGQVPIQPCKAIMSSSITVHVQQSRGRIMKLVRLKVHLPLEVLDNTKGIPSAIYGLHHRMEDDGPYGKKIANGQSALHRLHTTNRLSVIFVPRLPPPCSLTYWVSMKRQACASCSHRRSRCNADCPMARYFPPNRSAEFQNVHRLFGVANVLKITRNLEPEHRDDAMRSIILEAAIRAKDPVRGCLGVILDLHKQILWTTAELKATLARLHDVKQLLDTHHGNPAATHLGLPIRSFRLNPVHSTPSALLHGNVDCGASGPNRPMSFVEGSAWYSPLHIGGEASSSAPPPQPPALPAGAQTEDDDFKLIANMFDADSQPPVDPQEQDKRRPIAIVLIDVITFTPDGSFDLETNLNEIDSLQKEHITPRTLAIFTWSCFD